ncbi:restriction endonuclease subunit S [Yersinia kristensenii]|uniref:restriction endonuclease subunit S n=1 Tax=Yersinia kristensenii TaxID=28152 RepID=UPI0011A543EC|nr:restriction endonuclease subunit S [Yersinia kristensenii]
MSDARWIIPKNWAWTTISRIAKVVGGGTPSSKVEANFTETGIPWITPADLAGYFDTYISHGRRDLSEIGYASSGATLLPIGTVLFSSRAPIGYCTIAAKKLSTNQGFKNIILKGGVLPEYIRYYLLSSKKYAESLASGTTFLELSGQKVGEIVVPLAPFAEQKRIVAKIDKLLSRTANTRVELNNLPALIEKYKAGLLKKLFETPSETIDTNEVCLNDLVISVQNGLSKRRGDTGRAINVLRLSDLTDAKFKGEAPRAIDLTEAEEEKFTLHIGDLLCIRVNGSRNLVGKMLTWNSTDNWAFCDHFIRYSLDTHRVIPEYVQYYFATDRVRNIIETSFVSSAGQKTVNQSLIGNILLPLPSKTVQTEIVRRIKSAFSWLDQVSNDCALAASKLSTLESGILLNAFKGRLLPQDLNDESVNLLLARISTESISIPKISHSIHKKDKLMITDPKTRFLQDSENWPERGLPFVEVAQRNPIPHDTMRDIIFSLLSEENPKLLQFFDKEAGCIYLKRVRK